VYLSNPQSPFLETTDYEHKMAKSLIGCPNPNPK
jgi:hypothetical protein